VVKIALTDIRVQLPLPPTDRWPEGVWDVEAFKHGSMSVVLFAPQGGDYQTSHEQDELYIVLSGSGTLDIEDTQQSFAKGDVLFVPAGKRHHFKLFTADLVTWAVFWGPVGGEQ
jgi:mannose-6-phosphate isomerase-like protein (cupin superfamily)